MLVIKLVSEIVILALLSLAVTCTAALRAQLLVLHQGVKTDRSKSKQLFMASLLLMTALGSTSSFAYSVDCPDGGYPLNGCTLPGVVDGGYPYFDNVVTVKYNGKKLDSKGYSSIKAKGVKGSVATLYVDDGEPLTIEKPKFKLKAKVYEDGTTGTLKLKGKIDGSKFGVTANLNPEGKQDKTSRGQWDVSGDSMLWGFDIYDITCKGLDGLVDCTTAGSASTYLNLLSAIGPGTGFDKLSTAGAAVTSVPVSQPVPLPAAAYLFGSGLLGLGFMSRLRKFV